MKRFSLLLLCFFQMISEGVENWTCGEPFWPTEPVVEEKVYKGTIQRICTFDSQKYKEDFGALIPVFTRALEEKAHEIFAGPEETVFEGMPATYYDGSTLTEIQGKRTEIRYDIHAALLMDEFFVVDLNSTDIKSNGFAKNMQKLIERIEVHPLSGEMTFEVLLSGYTEVKKPMFLTEDLFLRIVKGESEKGIEEATNDTKLIFEDGF